MTLLCVTDSWNPSWTWTCALGVAEVEYPLPPRRFDPLRLFVEKPDRTITKDEILETVWPGAFSEGSVNRAVARTCRCTLRSI